MSDGMPARIFINYSHRDRERLERLQVHLRPLVRGEEIELWEEHRLRAGDRWRQEIKDAVYSARAARLHVSANPYASDFIATDELPALVDADGAFGTVLIPVLISASRFHRDRDLSQFQAVDSTPLAELEPQVQEQVLDQEAQRIEQLLGSSIPSQTASTVS